MATDRSGQTLISDQEVIPPRAANRIEPAAPRPSAKPPTQTDIHRRCLNRAGKKFKGSGVAHLTPFTPSTSQSRARCPRAPSHHCAASGITGNPNRSNPRTAPHIIGPCHGGRRRDRAAGVSSGASAPASRSLWPTPQASRNTRPDTRQAAARGPSNHLAHSRTHRAGFNQLGQRVYSPVN